MRTPAVGGVIAAFIAVGCAQTKAYTPEASPVRVELRGLQANRVSVEVNDLRADKNDGDSLTALSANRSKDPSAGPLRPSCRA